ncbi:hypothetical protein ABGB08_14610 [Acrocarpospora sp. B8E8]
MSIRKPCGHCWVCTGRLVGGGMSCDGEAEISDAKLMDALIATLARAEEAEVIVARVRKAADEMAATPPGYGKPPTARGTWARAGRVILAALDAKDAGESQ